MQRHAAIVRDVQSFVLSSKRMKAKTNLFKVKNNLGFMGKNTTQIKDQLL